MSILSLLLLTAVAVDAHPVQVGSAACSVPCERIAALQSTQRDTLLGPLRSLLRMIATEQGEHYEATGTYHKDLNDLRWLVGDPAETGIEVTYFAAHDSGWAAVAQNIHGECTMFYGRIESPREYATRGGRAQCMKNDERYNGVTRDGAAAQRDLMLLGSFLYACRHYARNEEQLSDIPAP